MICRNPLSLVFIASLLLGAGPGAANAPPDPAPAFTPGEKLVYDARVWKGLSFLGMSVGKATLEVRESDRREWPDAYLFYGRAQGGALGYSAVATVRSYLDSTTRLPLGASLIQRGSESHDKQMVFQGNEILYLKKKHCKEYRTCVHQRHLIWNKKSRGFLQGYEVDRRHCRDKYCGNRAHHVWQVRDRHPVDRPTFDMLSVIYICRGMTLPVGGKGEEIRVVNAHDVWDVSVRATGREKVEVPAGKFRCIRIQIAPKPAADGTKIKKEFEGLFGIRGKIRIWVDEKTRIPVKIQGVVPFGVDLNMEVSLLRKEIPATARQPGA